MKRLIIIISLSFLFIPTAFALSWAYVFVVWNGNVYEVLKEEVIPEEQVGKKIGKVQTRPNNMSGNYFGNASNGYKVGTHYYEIIGTPRAQAIAVAHDKGTYVKAIFRHAARFHPLNIIANPLFITAVSAGALFLFVRKFRYSQKT